MSSETFICQGREVSQGDLEWLRATIGEHPDWSRHRITQQICQQWDWHTHTGQIKTFAARSLIDKLEAKGLLMLPPIRTKYRRILHRVYPAITPPDATPIHCPLAEIMPMSITLVTSGSFDHGCFGHYLHHHHYIGFNCTVGEHLEYLVRDRKGRDVACVLFGASAWRCAPRDRWIGWDEAAHRRNLNFTTNNTRFLILPWVRVPHLASHILGRVSRRLSTDWIRRYGHPVHLVETFVERDRFKGTCYKAANWQSVGQTKGRSRNDQHTQLSVPIKDVLVHPLCRKFRKHLCRS
jgi:hypothetical protein